MLSKKIPQGEETHLMSWGILIEPDIRIFLGPILLLVIVILVFVALRLALVRGRGFLL